MLPDLFPGITTISDLIMSFRENQPEVRSLSDKVKRQIKLLLLAVVYVSSAILQNDHSVFYVD